MYPYFLEFFNNSMKNHNFFCYYKVNKIFIYNKHNINMLMDLITKLSNPYTVIFGFMIIAIIILMLSLS